jgi:hypothetical protein
MSEPRQTIASANQRIAAHEALCAERYRNIESALSELKETLRWATRGAWAGAFLLLAWALVQVYAIQPLRLDPGRGAEPVQPPPAASKEAGTSSDGRSQNPWKTVKLSTASRSAIRLLTGAVSSGQPSDMPQMIHSSSGTSSTRRVTLQ